MPDDFDPWRAAQAPRYEDLPPLRSLMGSASQRATPSRWSQMGTLGKLGAVGGTGLSILWALSMLKEFAGVIPGMDWLTEEGRTRRFERARDANSMIANAMLLQGDQASERRAMYERGLDRSAMREESRMNRLSQGEMAKTMMLLGMLGGRTPVEPPTPYQPINMPGLR